VVAEILLSVPAVLRLKELFRTGIALEGHVVDDLDCQGPLRISGGNPPARQLEQSYLSLVRVAQERIPCCAASVGDVTFFLAYANPRVGRRGLTSRCRRPGSA
jgi:hypothetical protein